MQEEVDAGVFGNLAHFSLEFLYLGYRERKKSWHITAEAIADLKKNWVRPAVEKAIRKHYDLPETGEIPYSGQLLVVREVLDRYVQAVLDRDSAAAPFQLVGLEVRCETEMPISLAGRQEEVALQGVIDRVDLREEEGLRLLDYKSGADKKDFPSVPSLFDRADPKRNKAVMQTFFYGYLYRQAFPTEERPLKPGLINLKDIFNPQFSPYLQLKEQGRGSGLPVTDYRQYAEVFEEGLRGLLEEIFAPEQAFSQTEDLKKCSYCPYKALCGRN
ncbi:hypothetical protein A3SI_10024 [Nitritalea halalkaliphila LW7]|uniref:PD-(D/E)XK endonuclease-like domain-containing protein n=1 Tax=Nitritalea halalkaliphila LW7 TaxID=1189621 RepID=I5C3G9_9BACT|nr:PD-(D/E)XK nuclease family protein [Nitritalea halalkaliphila]EIM76371.1 hypothetical protein A3SI_10024 [Nitritalea halalkaliphila LW7]